MNLPHTGPKVLLEGGAGTGKTHSIRTLTAKGIQVNAIFTEPRWGSVADVRCSDGFHIHYVNPTNQAWSSLIDKATHITKVPWDAASKWTDPKKSTYDGYIRILQALNNFTCVNCGEAFGDATTWDSKTALWLDGLSGLNQASLQMVTGGAMTRSQPQWGAAMDAEVQLIKQCVYGTRCWFILVAHLDKLVDEINGGMIVTPNGLGRKVGPSLPQEFDEVILAEREGDKFKWSTAASGVDLKATYLPIRDTMAPDFGAIYDKWVQGAPVEITEAETGT